MMTMTTTPLLLLITTTATTTATTATSTSATTIPFCRVGTVSILYEFNRTHTFGLMTIP